MTPEFARMMHDRERKRRQRRLFLVRAVAWLMISMAASLAFAILWQVTNG